MVGGMLVEDESSGRDDPTSPGRGFLHNLVQWRLRFLRTIGTSAD